MSNRMLKIAKKLRANGILGVVKSYTSGGGQYDPATGKINARGSTSADSTRAMVLMDQLTKTPSRSYGSTGLTVEVNTLIEDVQKWCLMDATGREPKMQDHIIASGKEWNIINIQVIADVSGPVMYVLALKA